MAFDVASGIKKLLFKNETVIIPGFGGFVLEALDANIDYIKSQISPPSRVPTFNKNLTLNDGVLIDFIKTESQCSQEEANELLEAFLNEVNEKIENKEIVEFPKVGRIYKDYNKQLQFLPYDTNFNTNVFGLPVIEARPFSRNEEIKSKAAVASSAVALETANANIPKVDLPPIQEETVATGATQTATIQIEKEKKKSGFFGLSLPMLALAFASILMVLLSYFFLFKKGDSGKDKASTELAEGKRINEAPTDPDIEEIPEDGSTESESENDIVDDLLEDEKKSSSSLSSSSEEVETVGDEMASSGSKECIIIVGQFGNKRNLNRQIKKVESDGYESFTDWNPDKQLDMVGVRFSYSSELEKEEMLELLQAKYSKQAWFLEED